MTKVKVILHGNLKELCPDEYIFEVSTAKEALQALSSQARGLRVGGRHSVRVLGFDRPEMLLQKITQSEIHVVPSYAGSKNSLVQIGLGVLLIGFSVITGNPFAAQAAWSTTFAFSIGSALVLGGLSQLLAPAPTTDSDFDADPDSSNIMPSSQNTTKIGTPIPLGFGRHKVYGQVLSLNVDSSDLVTFPTPANGVTYFGSP